MHQPQLVRPLSLDWFNRNRIRQHLVPRSTIRPAPGLGPATDGVHILKLSCGAVATTNRQESTASARRLRRLERVVLAGNGRLTALRSGTVLPSAGGAFDSDFVRRGREQILVLDDWALRVGQALRIRRCGDLEIHQ